MSDRIRLHADFVEGALGSTLVRVNASLGKESVIKTVEIEDFLKILDSAKYTKKIKTPKKVSSGFLPENTFLYSKVDEGYELAVFVPGSVRLLRVNNEIVEVPVPSAIMVFNQNTILRWRACACKSMHELNKNTPLYHWPFGHVYDNGSVCVGNVKTSTHQEVEVQEVIENLLMADNTHSNTKVVKLGETISAIRDKNLKEFPKKLLISCNQTLDQLMNGLKGV